MATPAPRDRPEQRARTVTRSGRVVRPPDRYEPDPDEVLEDDFSDAPTDSDAEDHWRCGVEDRRDRDDDGSSGSEDSRDSSYQSCSTGSSISSGDDGDSLALSQDTDGEEEYEDGDAADDDLDAVGDVLNWDTLTVDCSDEECSYSAEDDRDE